MTTPPEPDWGSLIDEILGEDDENRNVPTGTQERYLSQHTRNISFLEVFEWPKEFIDDRPYLKNWLQLKFEEWWEEQMHDAQYADGAFENWMNGDKIIIHGDAYIDELNKKLVALYRERITETHTCSDCGKEASEKHLWGHPDSVHKLHIVGEEAKLLCAECWYKRHPNLRRRRR
ncbi:hypothetical protein LCGC14_1079880 [marine sediment metagenome]|uniref:Uncharacterized protein n=1 Tax=marine sediment metagenome TaxID=412755 RepID=A0A0F9PYN6_9ZZZZ